jgi:peroxiredoxin
MIYLAFRANTNTSLGTSSVSLDEAVREFRSQRDASLFELSSTSPTLVVFLRHAGCTFCRETLTELKKHRAEFQRSGASLAIVHMGTPMDGTMMSQKYGLHYAHRFSDPDCLLYRAFGLLRGRFKQLFSTHVVIRGLRAMLQGHGIGKLTGDGFRLPGAFVLIDGKVVVENRATSAADRPDFLSLLAAAGSRVRRSTEMPRRASELSEPALGRS